MILDAAQFGSRAHRVRAYWTNLLDLRPLQACVLLDDRDPELYVDSILGKGRTSAPVSSNSTEPFFPCNFVGQRRRALPTFVSFPNSQAYREGKAGIIWDSARQCWDVPTADERERAMGFQTGTTAGRGIMEDQRRGLLGQAMDLNALKWLSLLILVQQAGHRREGLSAPLRKVSHHANLDYKEEEEAVLTYLQSHPALAAVDPGKKEWTLGVELCDIHAGALRQVLQRHPTAFSWTSEDLGRYTGPPMTIELKDDSPVWRKQYRLSAAEQEVVERKTQALVEAGLVEESTTTHGFASPTVLPPKKDVEGKTVDWRMCGNYRALNSATVSDKYVMPTPEEIFGELGKASTFSSLDLRQGFQQIPMHADHKHKTAFWAGNRPMEWKFMPFGLKNASAKFQRVMDEALQGLFLPVATLTTFWCTACRWRTTAPT